MENIVKFNEIKDNNNFWFMFFAYNFPLSLDQETDMSLTEIMEDNYSVDMRWIDDFTGYYDGVIDEGDGYIDDPKRLKIELATGNNLYIEFHPGDTVYLIDNNEIGCTGPHYFVHRIAWSDFKKYSENLSDIEKILLLPMVYIKDEEKKELQNIVYNVLNSLELMKEIEENDYDIICRCIIAHCTDD